MPMPMPMHRRNRCRPRRVAHSSLLQRGVGAVVVIVLVVVLAGMAAGVLRLSWGSQVQSAQDAQMARARMAARAGIEWGLFQAVRGSWTACNSSQLLDLRSTTGMRVRVSCTSASPAPYVEGTDASGVQRTVRIHNIEAIACNGLTTCPETDAAVIAGQGYVERRQRVSISSTDNLP